MANRALIPLIAHVTLIAFSFSGAQAKPNVLNCEIKEGAPKEYRSLQIMIDEAAGIVIYHFQLVGTDPKRQVGPDQYVDLSMKITMKNDKMIMANDESGAFVMTKHDGKFVKASVMLVPLPNGNFAALGNTHWGTCVKSPFH